MTQAVVGLHLCRGKEAQELCHTVLALILSSTICQAATGPLSF